MSKLRYGIVGTGGMGSGHARTMQGLEDVQLAAVCDIVPEVAEAIGEQYNVPYMTDYHDLIARDDVDAVVIATPHYFHPEIAIHAMENGKPALSEKPISVTVAQADAMVEAAKRTGVPFCVMHQSRSEPVWQAAWDIVKSGRLGELYRTLLVYADYRSQAYYDSAGWRATWAGEGGGVLINQAPHSLDRFAWLGGLPSRITALTKTNGHVIEVEDVAAALLEYPNGGVGYVYCCTNEWPPTNIMELCGEKGKLQVIGRDIHFWELPQGVRGHSDSTENMWDKPEVREAELTLPEREHGHGAILRNFARHIMHGEDLIAPGIEGLWSVELINGIILSGATGQPVDVPVDRAQYELFLAEKIKTSKHKGTGPDKRVTDTVHH
jgi:predicted dehydrogenase